MTRTQRRAESRKNKTPFIPIIKDKQPQVPPKVPTPSVILPDPAKKGQKGLNCNRTDCQSPGAIFYHKCTRFWYCASCAYRINDVNRGDSMNLYGVPDLCELDDEAFQIHLARTDDS